jgi:hypothetical protein
MYILDVVSAASMTVDTYLLSFLLKINYQKNLSSSFFYFFSIFQPWREGDGQKENIANSGVRENSGVGISTEF